MFPHFTGTRALLRRGLLWCCNLAAFIHSSRLMFIQSDVCLCAVLCGCLQEHASRKLDTSSYILIRLHAHGDSCGSHGSCCNEPLKIWTKLRDHPNHLLAIQQRQYHACINCCLKHREACTHTLLYTSRFFARKPSSTDSSEALAKSHLGTTRNLKFLHKPLLSRWANRLLVSFALQSVSRLQGYPWWPMD